MIIILGLIILASAVVVGVAGVLTNHGSRHVFTHGFTPSVNSSESPPRAKRLLAATAVIALIGAVVGPAAMESVAGAAVSAVSFTPTSSEAGVNTTWSVDFTSGSALAAGNTITVTFALRHDLFEPGGHLDRCWLWRDLPGQLFGPRRRRCDGSSAVIVTLPAGCTLSGSGDLTVSGVVNPPAATYPATTSRWRRPAKQRCIRRPA